MATRYRSHLVTAESLAAYDAQLAHALSVIEEKADVVVAMATTTVAEEPTMADPRRLSTIVTTIICERGTP